MSTVIMTRLEGVTRADYDSLRALVGWDREVPSGLQAHIASFDDDGVLRIAEVWDSTEQRDVFTRDRVNPALGQLGITVGPQKIIAPAHSFFVPATHVTSD